MTIGAFGKCILAIIENRFPEDNIDLAGLLF